MSFTTIINEIMSARTVHGAKSKNELFGEATTSPKGDTKLKKSSINDKHIKDTIELFAVNKGMSVQDATEKFKLDLAKHIQMLGTSKMNKNAVDNAAESVAFNYISELEPETLDLSKFGIKNKSELLDRDVFFDLTQYVIGENSQFFPLRNPFESKAVRPYFFITPDHLPLISDPALKNSAEHNCGTAFCTPNAEMVFSRKFTEQLAISALLNNEKPKSKKYKANGGPIPDHYAYLEFVMMHELLHFSAGDHFYTKQMVKKIQAKHPKSAATAHKILNYVGDFINNWQLAKSGYVQLPIGLFSEEINYDKFETYEDIIDAVVKEMEDMSKSEADDMDEKMKEGMDEHMDNPDDTPSQGGEDSQPDDTPEDQQKNNDNSNNKETTIFKIGDKVTINKDGSKGVVIYASKPDSDGKQKVKIVPWSPKANESVNALNEKQITTLSSDDITMWDGNDDSGDSGDSGEPQDRDNTEQGDDEKPLTQEEMDELWNSLSDEEKQEMQDAAEENGDDLSDGPSVPSNEPDEDKSEESSADAISKAIDNAMKQNNENIEQRDDGNDDVQSSYDKQDTNREVDANSIGQIKSGSAKVDFTTVKTIVNWKKLLKKMIPKGKGDQEDTYSKMSRQATSSMVTAAQTGAGRISPGEVTIDSTKKGLVFVIDNSGSVMNKVNEFNQEIISLLKKNKKLLENMYIIKFSRDFNLNKVDVKTMKYQEIQNPEALFERKGKLIMKPAMGIKTLFGQGFAGGTYYTNEMHDVIDQLHKANMNIIMFTDDDLVADARTEKLFKLAKKRKNSVAMFITDKRSYQNMSDKFGKVSWMTILK